MSILLVTRSEPQIVLHWMIQLGSFLWQLRQLGDVCRDPLRIIALAAIAGKN